MKQENQYYRGLALCLCLALFLMLLGCSKNTATNMHLEKYQGSVAVVDGEEEDIKVRAGMQLYSGYRVGTAQESLAWIALDKTKAVKMDALSIAQIQLSGKKLELSLHEGNLFFDVSKPLEEDESFTIVTSTMVTGIRGTCGWVEVLDPYTTRVVLLEGTVTVESIDPETGERRQTVLTGGQILTVVYYGDGSNGEDAAIQRMIGNQEIISGNIIHTENGLRVEQLQEDRVPDFVRDEVAQSTDIQKRITESTDLSVPEILGQQTPQGPQSPENSQSQGTPEVNADSSGTNTPAPQPTQAPQANQQQNPAVSTPPELIPVGTEIYYEEVIVETWEWVPVTTAPNASTPTIPSATNPTTEPTTPTAPSSPTETTAPAPTTAPTTQPTESTAATEPSATTQPTSATEPSATTQPTAGPTTEQVETRQYRPKIQLYPNASMPSYAIVTHAEEITLTNVTRDANGNVLRTEFVSSRIVEYPEEGTQTVSVTNGYITFTDRNGSTITLAVSAAEE